MSDKDVLRFAMITLGVVALMILAVAMGGCAQAKWDNSANGGEVVTFGGCANPCEPACDEPEAP